MAESKYTELFRFEAKGMDKDKFHVLCFSGTEGLSSLFAFDIDLVSKDKSLDLEELLSAKATLTVKRGGDAPDAVFAGRLSAARQTGSYGDYAYYSVTLRPAFWKFTQLVQSAIFLNKNAPDTVRELFDEQRFMPINYDMRLSEDDYPAQEFAMQHEESIYDYITWRMEQQGAYFYFAPDGDTVIFADSPQSHDKSSGTIYYSPTTGLEVEKVSEVATAFSLSQMPLPARVVVRSYSWKNPNATIVAEAKVSQRGMGDVYLAHEPVETKADAQRIAEIRAEELKCHAKTYSGVSASPIIRPGAVFTLERHYSDGFNRDYMVTEVTHEGAQEAFISMGLGIPIRGGEDHHFYRNEFRCIESNVTFRPQRKAPRAKITGVMRAFVDGAGSGARAEMDEYGRYKLVFPFDVSGRDKGNASCWIRMSQQSVGANSGLALPVQPGVEALVSFEEGDPDRPYISGLLANGESGISGSGNANITGLTTAGGSHITINDSDKHQGISMLTPSGHGMLYSAGSSGLEMSQTDNSLHTSTCSMNSLSTFAANNFTGYRTKTEATNFMAEGTKLASWAAIVQAAASMTSGVLDSLSQTSKSSGDSEAESWAAAGVKTAVEAANLVFEVLDAADKTNYGVSLTAEKNSASSLIQTHPSLAQLIAMWTMFSATGSAEIIVGGINANNLSKVGEEDGEGLYYSKDYEKVSKTEAIQSYSTSTAVELLPEITAMIVAHIAANKQAKILGGIQLNAAEQNINLTAATGISASAGKAIVFHAGELPAAKNNDSTTNAALLDMNGVRQNLCNTDGIDPALWGAPKDVYASVVRNLLFANSGYLDATGQGLITYNLYEKEHNISSIADLIYDRSENAVRVANGSIVDYADTAHISRAGNKGATLAMTQNKWLGYAPSNGSVMLGVPTEDGAYPTNASDKIDNAANFSGLCANKTAVGLFYNFENSVVAERDIVTIQTGKIGNNSSLIIKPEEAELKSGTITLESSNDATSKVEVANGSVTVCDVKFESGGKLAGKNGILALNNGAVKIFGS